MAVIFQLTVRDPGDLEAGISQYEHRHAYETQGEAEEAIRHAQDSGFDAKLDAIKTRERQPVTASTYVQEEPCFDWCPANPVYAGKLEDAGKWLFGNEPDHNLVDWTYDKTLRVMGLEPCHDCHGNPGDAGCMSCDDTGINPFPNAGRRARVAQESGGGDGGGGDGSVPGSGPGGDAYGGGAPDTGAGATLGESPHGGYNPPSFGPQLDSGEEPETCERCGDKCYSSANGTYWNCARCGWTSPSRRRKRREDERDAAAQDDNMTGTGCGRCGSPDHTSERCPSNQGHNMTPNEDKRHLNYDKFQPQTARVAQVDVTPAEPGDKCDDDGEEAVATFKGKRVCVRHLREDMEKAQEELPQAAEGIATTIGPTRLKWENVVQDTKEDLKKGRDILEQEDLKKRMREIQSASAHDYGPCPDCGLPWWDGAPKCPTCGLDVEDLEAASEWMDRATVVPKHLAPPEVNVENGLSDVEKERRKKGLQDFTRPPKDGGPGNRWKWKATTQEIDMYNCEKCGGQATHEAVTYRGARGLLCSDHATTYRIASQAAGLGALVFPLTKEAFDLASCPGCGHYLDNHSWEDCSGSLSGYCACKKAHGPDPEDLKEHIKEDQGEFEDLKGKFGELSDTVQGMIDDDVELKEKLAGTQELESQSKGQCVRCGKDVFVGDASKFENLGEDKYSCTNCAPLVAQNLETYRSASAEHLAYLYEQDPDWEKVGQNIGCPNCEGTGHDTAGKICQACFGTGHGGGMMIRPTNSSVQAGLAEGLTTLFDVADKNLNACPSGCGCASSAECKCQGCPEALKNAQNAQRSPKGTPWPIVPGTPAPPVAASKESQVDMPPDAAYGILYGDDGDTYRTTDGVNWEKVGQSITTEGPPRPGDQLCSICQKEPAFMKVHLETGAEVHWGGKCVQDVKAGKKPGSWRYPELAGPERQGATEHNEEEEEEDDDLKLFRQDHGPGQGHDVVHSEIHQQEHTGAYDDANVNGMARDLDAIDYARIDDPEAYKRDCCDTWNDESHAPGCSGDVGLKQGSFQKEAPYGIPKEKGGDSEENDANMEDCVRKVMAKGKAEENAIRICKDSLGFTKEEHANLAWGKVSVVTVGDERDFLAGTSIHDLVDEVGTGEHPVPVELITDHVGLLATGAEPAQCRYCYEPIERHAQWSPTRQSATGAKPKPKKPKKKETPDEKARRLHDEKAKKNEEAASFVEKAINKADQFIEKPSGTKKVGQSGTSVKDLVDNVGDGQHSVPVELVVDHRGEVEQRTEPATCKLCGKPMSQHAQWSPTKQRRAQSNPAFPQGQCPACGTGLDLSGRCTDSDCSNYGRMMGLDDEQPIRTAQRVPFNNEQGYTYTDDDEGREQEFLDSQYQGPFEDDECKGCGKWLSPVTKAMDDIPYCTDCIRSGKSSHLGPVRGSLEKEAHYPSYDLAYHDIQSPMVGARCQFCGQGSNQVHGAVKSFPDPANPIEQKVVAHQPHFDDYRAASGAQQTLPTATKTVGGEGSGGGVTINVYAAKDEDS